MSKKEPTINVTVPWERLEELMDIETRVDVLISSMRTDDALSKEKAFRILGYLDDADMQRKKDEDMMKKFNTSVTSIAHS